MAKKITNIGKVSINPRDEWNILTSNYEYLDLVQYLGSSFLVKLKVGYVPVGILPTNTTYFTKIVEKGDKGDKGEGGSTDWNDITNKPTVIGAGATQSDARAAIGAGTSNLTLGLTNTTAKAGDYTPSMSDVTGLNTALSNKVDKVAGKSLIDDNEITRLATVTNFDNSGNVTALGNKVDKIVGKGLSEEDYTTIERSEERRVGKECSG